jgi:hypothetical protein
LSRLIKIHTRCLSFKLSSCFVYTLPCLHFHVDDTVYTLTRKPGVINIDEKYDTIYIYANKVRTLPSLVINIHVAPKIWEPRDQYSPGSLPPARSAASSAGPCCVMGRSRSGEGLRNLVKKMAPASRQQVNFYIILNINRYKKAV